MTTHAPAPTPAPDHSNQNPPSPTTEVAIAYATTAAPLVAGITAPFLADTAAVAAGAAYTATAAFTALNYMDRLPTGLTDQLPAGDILTAHRTTLAISTVTTGMSLGMGTLYGAAGTDAIMAGILDPTSISGIISLAWWTTVAFVPFKLRRILRRPRPHTTPTTSAAATGQAPADDPFGILRAWGTHISNPHTGTHRNQILSNVAYTPDHSWTGTITAPHGQAVTVTRENVSSVYRRNADWITINPGAHAGEAHITVNLVTPPELDTDTLAGAWKKWASRKGGLMEGTHLENIQDDPNTGGQVALVVAGERLDRLRHPDRMDLAGALRVNNPLLVSYEPRQNPREAVIRKMDRNPLQQGAAFPGIHVLKPNANGYIQLGPGVSGFPARIQLWDPALGAQHCIVAGVTGSGKGGTLQLVALAHHVNGSAIINADPKGSSNPAIDAMAAHSGLGPDAAMGALRIWYHGLQYRVIESARTGMKNFKSSPARPWVPLLLDEASKLLGENAEHRKEATFIINAGATLGRSLGMPVILANQLMQLAQLGGDAAIRDNVFYGGSLILLRSDSQQKHLIDLPENFAGCNPADIPPAWTGERDMVYDPTKPLNDPERTFGLAFAASPGGHAEMMRNWILEDATPYIDTNNIVIPTDWPFWDDRHALAEQCVLPNADSDGDDLDAPFSSTLPEIGAPTSKEMTADQKILNVLKEASDPMGEEINYLHRDDIGRMAGIAESTLANRLTALVKQDKIHRHPATSGADRGKYGYGPAPE